MNSQCDILLLSNDEVKYDDTRGQTKWGPGKSYFPEPKPKEDMTGRSESEMSAENVIFSRAEADVKYEKNQGPVHVYTKDFK